MEIQLIRRAKLSIGTLLLTLLASACGMPAQSQTSAGPMSRIPALQDLPEAQKRILSDAKVTRAEYESAFSAFAECVRQQGGRLEKATGETPNALIQYQVGARLGTPSDPDLSSPEGRCYHEYFDSVEYIFQLTDAAALNQMAAEQAAMYSQQIRPCLIKNGVKAPEDAAPGSAQFSELSGKWSQLNRKGMC